jgi:hypothetical protein
MSSTDLCLTDGTTATWAVKGIDHAFSSALARLSTVRGQRSRFRRSC